MADEQGIDPRYAAQFQRGYDPVRHAARPTAARETVARLAGGPPPSAPRAPERQAAPPRVVEAAASPEDSPLAEAEAPDGLGEEPASAAAPRAEWALLAIGLGLVVLAPAALWAYLSDDSRFTGAGSVEEQFGMLLLGSAPGPLFVSGIVAIALWIVVRSLRARRPR